MVSLQRLLNSCAVAIDDRRLTFAVKPGSSLLRPAPEGGPTIKFQTLKPMDYPTPYEAMLANGVQFSALDKRHGAFFSIMVRGRPTVWTVILLGSQVWE